MNPDEQTPSNAGPHPVIADLERWARFDLPDTEAASIERHLERCDTCALRLGSVEAPTDSILQKLRASAANTRADALPTRNDDNLVFGAFAVQAGLITPQQFADASVLLTSQGGGSMAELLIQREWIDEQGRAAVTKLLATHGGQAHHVPEAETLPGRELPASALDKVPDLHRDPSSRVRLIERHAQGGIGEVWRAFDTVLGREVALKELLPELRYSRIHRERFYHEAQVAAQLAHPSTAPVYGYHEEDGRHYYTMKFFSGRTLSEVIRSTHAAGRSSKEGSFDHLLPLLEHFLKVCDAIAYAHSKGIVHRDLKGENVMVGEYGEVTVIDWGLAKFVSQPEERQPEPVTKTAASRSLTLEGERLGTPGYMSPEQARGELSAIDELSDVYGLAAVLYEILTTKPPFSGETADEVMHLVESSAPPPPTLSHRETPPELEAICLRGLAKVREDRQASASAIRDEVREWLNQRTHQLHESSRLSKFFALSHDLFVFIDIHGLIKQVNPAHAHYFGYPPHETVGKHCTDRVHPDDVGQAKLMLQRAQLGLSQRDTILRIRSASGEYRTASWTLTRIADEPAIYAVGRPLDEVSERRRVMTARAQFFSLSPDLFVMFDENRLIAGVNEAWERLLGWTKDELAGKPITQIVHPDDLGATTHAGRKALVGGSVAGLTARVQKRDGGYLSVTWTLCRVPGDRVNYAIGRPA